MTIGGGLSPESGVQPSVLRAIGLTTIVTSLGYGVTLLQQVLYARTLGVNVETDALGASLAWVIGTTGFVGTTLASIFLPQFVRESRRDPVGALELRRRRAVEDVAVGEDVVERSPAVVLADHVRREPVLLARPLEQERERVAKEL